MAGFLRVFLSVILSGVVTGCSSPPQDQFVPPEQTPGVVTEAAQRIFPGFVLEQSWKSEEKSGTLYELRGKTPDGQSHEVTVNAEGKVLWPVQKE